MTEYLLVEGRTSPIDCIILADGVAMSLVSVTVSLKAYDKDGNLLTMPGTVTITDAAAGKVRYTPAGTSDLLNSKSPLRIRWILTDGSSKTAHVPSGEPDKWTIQKP